MIDSNIPIQKTNPLKSLEVNFMNSVINILTTFTYTLMALKRATEWRWPCFTATLLSLYDYQIKQAFLELKCMLLHL